MLNMVSILWCCWHPHFEHSGSTESEDVLRSKKSCCCKRCKSMHPKGTWIFQKRFLFHWSFFSLQLLPTDIGHSQGKMDWEQNFEPQLDAEKVFSPTHCSKLHSWNSCDDGYGYVSLLRLFPITPLFQIHAVWLCMAKFGGIRLKDCTIIYSLPSENPNKFDHFPPWKRNRKMEFPWISITSISNLNSPRTCQPLVGWAGSWMSWRVSHGESLQLRKGTSACVPFPNVCREGARGPGCKARSGWSLGGWKDLGGAILNLSFFS